MFAIVAVASGAGSAIVMFIFRAMGEIGVAALRTAVEGWVSKEDLDKVVKKLEATTRATEVIKQQLSHGTWVEQRAWEQRRDAYIAMLSSIKRVRYELNTVLSEDPLGTMATAQAEVEVIDAEMANMRATATLMLLVASDDWLSEYSKFEDAWNNVAHEFGIQGHASTYEELIGKIEVHTIACAKRDLMLSAVDSSSSTTQT